MQIIERFRAWLTSRRIARVQRAERQRMYLRALAFNKVHTFVHSVTPMWKCPSCGRVHQGQGFGKFSGPLFPACCEFEAGGRIGQEFATHLR